MIHTAQRKTSIGIFSPCVSNAINTAAVSGCSDWSLARASSTVKEFGAQRFYDVQRKPAYLGLRTYMVRWRTALFAS
jgi:hypothetical protein